MRRLNKKGIELQVNFVVILILTLVIFGASMAIAYKVLNKTNDLKAQVDATTRQRLETLLVSGNEEVVIPFSKKDDAKRGESTTFALGIVNLLGQNKPFNVMVSNGICVKSDGTPCTFGTWTYSYSTSTSIGFIKNNEHKIISLVFIVPKTAETDATYTFNVSTFYDTTNPYPAGNNVKKIRIVVVD